MGIQRQLSIYGIGLQVPSIGEDKRVPAITNPCLFFIGKVGLRVNLLTSLATPGENVRMIEVTIGILGLGTVGSAVFDELHRHGEWLARRSGIRFKVKRILVQDMGKKRDPRAESLVTSNPAEVLEDPSIQVVVELMGGYQPALDYVKRALHCGKQVVSANKHLLSNAWDILREACESGKAGMFFEAAVAGAVPIIRPLRHSLIANRIGELEAIVNGTTNFVLTEMRSHGASFAQALAKAQKLGYAEADPSADVDGLDAARKMAILSTLICNGPVYERSVSRRGIREVSQQDVEFAESNGFALKLLGGLRVLSVDSEGGCCSVSVSVEPALLPLDHPLAGVNDVLNGIWLKAEPAGELLFTGHGAGGPATASSVLGDLIFAANVAIGRAAPAPICGDWQVSVEKDERPQRWYLRADSLGVREMGDVAATMGIKFQLLSEGTRGSCGITAPTPRGLAEALAHRTGSFVARGV